jgi:dihydrofolate synthase/folylpolyglutamate synthase
MSDYKKALKYLENLQLFGIKLGLEQTVELLEGVGSPQKNLKFIHLAGSNGKGSCGAMLNCCLKSAGYVTGFYSSPHLISPRERFRINGEAISEEEFADLVFTLQPVAEKMAATERCPTYFEFTTAMAALHFHRKQVNFVVWETGMGGRFDATNIVDPICSIITGIAMDHQQYLGDSIEKIAMEKAGIIKSCRPVVLGNIPESAKVVITERADKLGALIIERPDQKISNIEFSKVNSIWMQDFDFKGHHINLSMPGAVQRENFLTVFGVLEYLAVEFDFSLDEALAGLAETFWPARCQLLPSGVIIDGAHNADGIKTLVSSICEFTGGKQIPIIFGGFKDKNTYECLELLEPWAEFFVFLPLSTEFRASWSGKELAEMLRKISNKKALIATNPENALNIVRKNEMSLICGSLYLAGEFLKELVPEQEILNI